MEFASARSNYKPSRKIPVRLLLQMLIYLLCSFSYFFPISLSSFIMQEDQKTFKYHERKLGKQSIAENLAKDYRVSELREAQLAFGWV